jgi:DNA-binding transcriptional MerR regulator
LILLREQITDNEVAMAKYDDKFKASAVITLQGAGYPDNPYKLKEVAKQLRVPHRTLRRWFNNETGAPSARIVTQEKRDMSEDLRKLFFKLIDHALDEDTIDEMTGQQAITSMGIVFDKMRLLMGLPTQIVGIMPEVVSALERAGENPEEVFKRLIERANHRAEINR